MKATPSGHWSLSMSALFLRALTIFPASLSLLALAVSCLGCASNLSAERAGEVDSAAKAFVQYGLDRRPEAYLVCVYNAEATGGYKHEVEIQATVVDRIKGNKRVGEKFAFRRGSDLGPVARGVVLRIPR